MSAPLQMSPTDTSYIGQSDMEITFFGVFLTDSGKTTMKGMIALFRDLVGGWPSGPAAGLAAVVGQDRNTQSSRSVRGFTAMAQVQTGAAGTTEASLEQQVRTRIESLSYLPTTVAVAMKFVELGKDPDAEPSEYAKVISSDSSLSSKLLSLANSSWFGVRNKVTKPQTAVNLLGLGTVRTLAISYCLTGLHNDLRLNPEESRMLWSASLCKAVAAKQYALQFDKKMGEEAFTAALFQDFAMAILYAVAREPMGAVLQDPQLNWQARLQKERDLFRLDHAEMGRVVAQKLELPDVFVDAVAFHHNQEHLQEMLAQAGAGGSRPRGLALPALPGRLERPGCRGAAAVPGRAHATVTEPAALLEAIQKDFNQIYGYFEDGGQSHMNLAELLDDSRPRGG